MKNLLLILFTCVFCNSRSQNNLSLSSSNGRAFRLIIKNRVFNDIPQAHVLVKNITQDTLLAEIEFENKKRFFLSFFFLEKGIPCRNKEFNYRIESDGTTLRMHFSGINDIIPLPDPLVPDQPQAAVQPDASNASKTEKDHSCTSTASQMLIERFGEKLGVCSNDSERYEVLKKGYSDLCYSVDQTSYLLNWFIHDREKIEAAKLLYARCMEKDKFSVIGNIFSSKQSAKELEEFIRAQGQ